MNQWIYETSGWVCNVIKELFPCAAVSSNRLKWRTVCQAQRALANSWGTDGGQITDTIWIHCHAHMQPLPTENFLVRWRCVWSSSNGTTPHQVWVQTHGTINREASRSVISCATSATARPVFFSLEFLHWHNRDVQSWCREAFLWMETGVNGRVSLAEWASGCWLSLNKVMMSSCVMVHQSTLLCSVFPPVSST